MRQLRKSRRDGIFEDSGNLTFLEAFLLETLEGDLELVVILECGGVLGHRDPEHRYHGHFGGVGFERGQGVQVFEMRCKNRSPRSDLEIVGGKTGYLGMQ